MPSEPTRGLSLAGLMVRFLALPGSHRGLLLEALGLVVAARAALWALPVSRVRRLLARLWPGDAPAAVEFSPEAAAVGWAVRAAAQRIPGAACLAQGLAGECMLRRRGHPVRLAMGFRRGAGGALEGHAWVDLQGEPVSGAGDDGDWSLLRPPMSGAP